MKKNRSNDKGKMIPLGSEAMRISDVCEDGMFEQFDPETKYVFGDLLSPSEQRRTFRNLFGHDILLNIVEGEFVLWSNTLQYASKLNFALCDTMHILYDAEGDLINPLCLPLDPYQTDFVKRDFRCNAIVHLARGKFVETEGKFGRIFYIDTSDDKQYCSHLLLATKWGGANDQTRGISREDAEEKGGIYFEKVTSNRGQEGVDYIIFPLEKCPRLALTIQHLFESIMREAKKFHRKWKLYVDLLKRIEQIEDDNWQLLDEAIALDEECLAQPIARLLFVSLPEGISTKELEMPTISLDMEETEMGRVVSQAETSIENVRLRLATKHVAIETWKEFAPRFASVQPAVRRLRGWLSVRGDHVILALPSAEKGKRYDNTTYAFSEQRLSDLLSDLDNYDLAEFSARQKNKERMKNHPSVEELLEQQERELGARKTNADHSETGNADEDSEATTTNGASESPTLEIEMK